MVFYHLGPLNGYPKRRFSRSFSRPISGLERFADNSNIPRSHPTIFHLGRTAEVPWVFLPSRRVSRNGGELMYRQDFHRLCHIPVEFSVSITFGLAFGSRVLCVFFMDKHVTIECLDHARPPRTCDCCATRTPRRGRCGPL